MTPIQGIAKAWIGATVTVMLGWGAGSQAQISPNCQRNGRPAFCAITHRSDPRQPGAVIEVITFADHTMVEARRAEGTCKPAAGQVIRCRATLLSIPGNAGPRPATCTGTAYEGGYRHDYAAQGLRISYSVLD